MIMFTSTLNKGFQMDFPNGYTISVQWGPGNYCANGGNNVPFDSPLKTPLWSSETAEVVVWNTETDETVKIEGRDVKGWCEVMDVVQLINWVANLK